MNTYCKVVLLVTLATVMVCGDSVIGQNNRRESEQARQRADEIFYKGKKLSINTPRAILEEAAQSSWVVTEGGGVTKIDNDRVENAAKMYLGQCYLLGYNGCPKDEEKAHELFNEMSHDEFVWVALNRLTGANPWEILRHQHIPSVRRERQIPLQGNDLLTAYIERVHEEADRGDSEAQAKLGLYYAIGMGVPVNPQESVKWLRQLADRGNADAQFTLAAYYAGGYGGLRVNKTECVKWLRRAAEQGHEEAGLHLEVFESRQRGSRRRGNDLGSPAPR
ncbi:MAG: sel1 repeat family protein [Planctomycetaceae bacterium]|jgi:TPR repeat protein|nr:sel1 repeat family protein [Planctomycetaceae bacterium]